MNEETRLLNPTQEESIKEPQNQKAAPSNNGKKTAAVAAGVAAGGLVGAAAAVGADHMFGQDEAEVPEAEVKAEAPAATVHTETVVHHVQEPARHAMPRHAQQHPHAQQHAQQHAQTQHAQAHNANPNQQTPEAKVTEAAADDNQNTLNPLHAQDAALKPASLVQETPKESESDSDVHVIGIEVFDAGDNQEGIMAVLEDKTDGQLAAVVDADSDGTIDVLVVDSNINKHIDAGDTFTDVHDQGYQTMDFINAYAEDQASADSASDGTISASYESAEAYAEPVEVNVEPAEAYAEPSYAPEPDYAEQDYMQEAYVPQDDYSSDYASDADMGFYEA